MNNVITLFPPHKFCAYISVCDYNRFKTNKGVCALVTARNGDLYHVVATHNGIRHAFWVLGKGLWRYCKDYDL